MICTIAHTAPLSHDYSGGLSGSRDEVEKDFIRLSSSFQATGALAHEHLKARYETSELFKDFCRTLLAGSVNDGIHTTFSALATGKSEECHISAALWPETFADYWSQIPGSDNPKVVEGHQASLFKRYLLIRRMHSSANSKFAHLVRSEVVPSFSQYRERRSSNADQKLPISMLDDENASPNAGYAKYVDSASGRNFAILDSGLMGLVPSGAEKGDLVVQIQSGGRAMWLSLRQEDF